VFGLDYSDEFLATPEQMRKHHGVNLVHDASVSTCLLLDNLVGSISGSVYTSVWDHNDFERYSLSMGSVCDLTFSYCQSVKAEFKDSSYEAPKSKDLLEKPLVSKIDSGVELSFKLRPNLLFEQCVKLDSSVQCCELFYLENACDFYGYRPSIISHSSFFCETSLYPVWCFMLGDITVVVIYSLLNVMSNERKIKALTTALQTLTINAAFYILAIVCGSPLLVVVSMLSKIVLLLLFCPRTKRRVSSPSKIRISTEGDTDVVLL